MIGGGCFGAIGDEGGGDDDLLVVNGVNGDEKDLVDFADRCGVVILTTSDDGVDVDNSNHWT